jgi:hypothetical protein
MVVGVGFLIPCPAVNEWVMKIAVAMNNVNLR